MREYTATELNELTYEFLRTEYGQYVVGWLSQQYNLEHQYAENEGISNEVIGQHINRAKGIKQAIDFFEHHKTLFEQEREAKKPQ